MAAADVQQGWEVAVSPTHLAVTLPSRVIAVYALQVSLIQASSCTTARYSTFCRALTYRLNVA